MIDTQAEAYASAMRKAPTARLRILEALKVHGPHTPDELSVRLSMTLYTARPRCSELGRDGLIHDTGDRRTTAQGCRAIVWALGDKPPVQFELSLATNG